MYSEHYKAFSENIGFAARILHYYLRAGALVKDENDHYKALNKNARFWNDYNFMALQTVIIFLGKIFDDQRRTHNLTKLIESLSNNLKHFNKSSLRKRKIKLSGEADWLDKYIEEAHELNAEDIELIKNEADKASALWKKFEPLRHRFYAHNQMITNKERDALFKGVTYDELQNLVQMLLNIAHVLEQAEINGQKPDFSDDYEEAIRRAEGEIDRLHTILIAGSNNQP